MRLSFDDQERDLLLKRLRLPATASDSDIAAAIERDFQAPAASRPNPPTPQPPTRPAEVPQGASTKPWGTDAYSTIDNHSDHAI